MAGLNFTAENRAQFAAIAELRWRLFFNSLRTTRGKVELLSRVVIGAVFLIAAAGGSIGLGIGAWVFTSHKEVHQLAVLLWPVFLFWQFFPIVVTMFSESADSQNLLRFPLSYRSYFLIYLVYGLFDPATLIGSTWLLGIFCGITLALPALAPFAAIVLAGFAVTNILLTRMLFSWVERWLAQRRTREVLGLLLFLFFLSFQFIGPITERYSRIQQPRAGRVAGELLLVQRSLPPGMSSESIAAVSRGHLLAGAGWLAALAGYGLAFFWLLHVRLLAQYRGENLSEAEVHKSSAGPRREIRPGWNLRGVPGAVAAVFEKDLRILSRSGPILLMLALPPLMLLVIRAGRLSSATTGQHFFAARVSNFAFPVGVAYSLLMLTNLIYNTFGADGSGMQFFFVSPVPFRQILMGKNLVHVVFLISDVFLVWVGVNLLYRPPTLAMTTATLAGLLFAVPLDLIGGNLLSIYSPKRVDYGTFGRQRASQLTVLAGMGIQFFIFAVAAVTLFGCSAFGSLWMAPPVFLVLGVLAFVAYFLVLNHVDAMALARREALVMELGKT